MALSVLSGLRQGEALGLRWKDVDVKKGVVHVRLQLDRRGELVVPKTPAAKRDVPIPTSLCRLLSAQRMQAFAVGRAATDNFVFASTTGGPLHPRNVSRRGLDKATSASGLPHLR